MTTPSQRLKKSLQAQIDKTKPRTKRMKENRGGVLTREALESVFTQKALRQILKQDFPTLSNKDLKSSALDREIWLKTLRGLDTNGKVKAHKKDPCPGWHARGSAGTVFR